MNLYSHHIRTVCLGIVAALSLAATVRADDIERARLAYVEWARLKSQLSVEQSDWRREKSLLLDTLAAARAEATMLDDRIKELAESSSGTDEKRADLLARIDAAKAEAALLARASAEAEAALRELVPQLPEPLQAELGPLLQRLPADPANTAVPVAQRLQTLAVALAQMEKFNSGFTVVSEIRDLGSGRSVEVKTLYLGLGAAYYADASGSIAGAGAPGATGWSWTPAEGDLAARIVSAIAIHENTRPPAFVALPLTLR